MLAGERDRNHDHGPMARSRQGVERLFGGGCQPALPAHKALEREVRPTLQSEPPSDRSHCRADLVKIGIAPANIGFGKAVRGKQYRGRRTFRLWQLRRGFTDTVAQGSDVARSSCVSLDACG